MVRRRLYKIGQRQRNSAAHPRAGGWASCRAICSLAIDRQDQPAEDAHDPFEDMAGKAAFDLGMTAAPVNTLDLVRNDGAVFIDLNQERPPSYRRDGLSTMSDDAIIQHD